MTLQDALEQIHTLLKMMTPTDRYDFFHMTDEKWPEEKLEDMLKDIMPGYKIHVYKTSESRHVSIETIASLDYIADDIIADVNGKHVRSIEKETFWEDELNDYDYIVIAINVL
jgi:hypothetical protein